MSADVERVDGVGKETFNGKPNHDRAAMRARRKAQTRTSYVGTSWGLGAWAGTFRISITWNIILGIELTLITITENHVFPILTSFIVTTFVDALRVHTT